MRFSVFNVYVKDGSHTIIKNMHTNAVIMTPNALLALCDSAPADIASAFKQYNADIQPFIDNGLVVELEKEEELLAWQNDLLHTRNDLAHRFTLHFLPTIQCQLRCSYCFENGADRGKAMKDDVLSQTIIWLEDYLDHNPEVDQLRMVLFGGEPLLQSDTCITALEKVMALCARRNIEFWSEAVTNGELLTEAVARKLSQFNWRRVQITIDGPEEIHNMRRPGAGGRKTFHITSANIKALLQGAWVPAVDIRLSFDLSNGAEIIDFLDELKDWGDVERINLSLGFITDTFSSHEGNKSDHEISVEALKFWKKAKGFGFKIPEAQIAGPLCVAVAKHSAVVLPDGSLQKCFATAGRPEYNFGKVSEPVSGYTKDTRYEAWKRTEDCVKEECSYLPVCGGGCPNDAMIAAGGASGGETRFCQKQFLHNMNSGLIELNYAQ